MDIARHRCTLAQHFDSRDRQELQITRSSLATPWSPAVPAASVAISTAFSTLLLISVAPMTLFATSDVPTPPVHCTSIAINAAGEFKGVEKSYQLLVGLHSRSKQDKDTKELRIVHTSQSDL